MTVQPSKAPDTTTALARATADTLLPEETL